MLYIVFYVKLPIPGIVAFIYSESQVVPHSILYTCDWTTTFSVRVGVMYFMAL